MVVSVSGAFQNHEIFAPILFTYLLKATSTTLAVMTPYAEQWQHFIFPFFPSQGKSINLPSLHMHSTHFSPSHACQAISSRSTDVISLDDAREDWNLHGRSPKWLIACTLHSQLKITCHLFSDFSPQFPHEFHMLSNTVVWVWTCDCAYAWAGSGVCRLLGTPKYQFPRDKEEVLFSPRLPEDQ